MFRRSYGCPDVITSTAFFQIDIGRKPITGIAASTIVGLLGEQSQLSGIGNLVRILLRAVTTRVSVGNGAIPTERIHMNPVTVIIAFVINDFAVYHITTEIIQLTIVKPNIPMASPIKWKQAFFITDSFNDSSVKNLNIILVRRYPLGTVSVSLPSHVANAFDSHQM